MPAIRRLLAQRHLAVLLCAMTLLLKLMVPAGYMVAAEPGRMAIVPCPGVEARPAMAAMAGMHGAMPGHGTSHDHAKVEMPCAFAGLSVASLGAADPVPLAAPIGFPPAIGILRIVAPAMVLRAHLRPPLRGPPLAI